MVNTPSDTPAWKTIAAAKQKQRLERIRPEWILDPNSYRGNRNVMDVPLTCGILNTRELEITSKYDALDLVEMIRDGAFSVEEVVTAFCKRAAVAQQVTNCLTEIMFEEAIATAKQMDLDRQRNPTMPLPPLFGLPISLKDSFKVPGVDTTIGFISLANKPSEVYGALPALLKDLGAVLHCKTNIPQTLMAADSDNNIFGRTVNPHNTSLSAGGSSGGEGALVAMRGSLIGVGTDIAGSIRIPSVCEGTYGFKPSSWVVPFAGQQSPVAPSIPGIMPVAGPLATSARACGFFMKHVMEALPWKYDGTVLHLPWTGWQPKTAQPLRIGFVEDNGVHTPSPPMRRALRETIEKLQRAGHYIIPVKFDNVHEIVDKCWNMYSFNGSEDMMGFISASGEPLVPAAEYTGLVYRPRKSLEEMISLSWARLGDRSICSKVWTRYNIDFLLTPPAPHTAVPHDTWLSVAYTAFFNYLDWPAVVLPTGTVSKDDTKDSGAKYGPEDENIYRLYTGPEAYADAPTTVQLVGQPQEDEKLAYYATLVDRILKSSS